MMETVKITPGKIAQGQQKEHTYGPEHDLIWCFIAFEQIKYINSFYSNF